MLLQQFQYHLKQNFNYLSEHNCKLLLAVSGGIDSVVLTDLFNRLNFDFVVAHCNFQLREEESIRDEVFTRTLAAKYKKQIFVKRFNTNQFAEQQKISIQEAARKLRYDWFNELIESLKLQAENANNTLVVDENSINQPNTKNYYVVTAHNADDNIETSLFFFLRGTGIHGLTGIKLFDKERKIIRPLLFATRKEIVEYAKENNISWVEDSSNATEKYTRNFLRNTFIPVIAQHVPSIKNNLSENISRFKEIEIIYNEAIQSYKKDLMEFEGHEIHIPVLKLQKIKALDSVLWEIIKDFSFHPNQVIEIKKLFAAGNSSYVQSSTHKIIKNRKWFIISTHQTKQTSFILIEDINKIIEFENGSLKFEILLATNTPRSSLNTIAQLDAGKIKFPLILRKWKQGDYFYPLGMEKKKKLSRFFIDLKLSKTQKENIWVLETDKKIVWVIGYRVDNRFKVALTTKNIVSITLFN